MAAEDCLLRTVCRPGDHVLIPDDAYGGTYRLLARVLADWGISYRAVRLSDIRAVRDALAERPARVIWTGAPPNPLLSTTDITARAEVAPAPAVEGRPAETPAVAEVFQPGLPAHPGHDIAAKQMRDFGGMVSCRLRGGEHAALQVCERTRLFTLGESLGGVESLIEHPGRMTHASAAGSPLAGPPGLLRLSGGIESFFHLLEDLRHA